MATLPSSQPLKNDKKIQIFFLTKTKAKKVKFKSKKKKNILSA
jgi:hypothetical protein